MLFAQETVDTTAAAAGAGVSVIFSGIIGLVWLAIGIYSILDVNKHTEADFEGIGQKRQNWLILTIVGTLCCGLINLYYLFGVRPKLPSAA